MNKESDVCLCMCVCVRACVRACLRACVCVCESEIHQYQNGLHRVCTFFVCLFLKHFISLRGIKLVCDQGGLTKGLKKNRTSKP